MGGTIIVMPMRIKKAKKDTPASIRYIVRCDSGPWAFKPTTAAVEGKGSAAESPAPKVAVSSPKKAAVSSPKKAAASPPKKAPSSPSKSDDDAEKEQPVTKPVVAKDTALSAASRAAAAAAAGGADSS